MSSYQSAPPNIKTHSGHNNLKGLFIRILFTPFIIWSVTSLQVGAPLPIMHFEPDQIQATKLNFLRSHDITTTGSIYSVTFSVLPQRINANGNNCHCVAGMTDFQLSITTTLGASSALRAFSNLATFCDIIVDSIGKNIFASLTFSVMFFRVSLQVNKELFVYHHNSSPDSHGNPICQGDGRTSLFIKTCQRHIPILPSIQYKLFTFLTSHTRITPSTTSNKPFYSIQIRLVSLNSLQFTFQCQFLQTTFWATRTIFIHQKYFDTTKRQPFMFSLVINNVQNAVSPFPFNITFPHYISHSNFFMGISSYKGFQYSLRISQNNTPDTFMKGISQHIGNALGYFALGIYAYSELCPAHLTMPCQKCPQHCKTCHVWPNFHCFQCDKGFSLSIDKLSCECQQKFVGSFCANFTPGCTVPYVDLTTGHFSCKSCNITQKLILIGNVCQCIKGYSFDQSFLCKSICGDSFLIDQQECDDGNNLSGDGCSSDCKKEQGIQLDKSKYPPTLRSQLILKYKVYKILKNEGENSVRLYLTSNTSQKLPIEVNKEQFDPVQANIKLKIVVEQVGYEEKTIDNLLLIEVNKEVLVIEFDYEFNIENLEGQISLNYQNTNYKNQTQTLRFQFKGDNYVLKVSKNQATYKAFGNLMLAIIILNALCLITGFFTSKFIGLQSILTCQIIYFSQLMIDDISCWPSALTFLNQLKYSTGYNGLLQFTDYILISTMTKKMHNLGLKKLLIENFNLNFLILFTIFICFILCSIIRKSKQTQISQKFRVMKENKTENFETFSQQSAIQLSRLDKINEITFSIANQISLWLLLPLLSSVSADFLIPNNQFTFMENIENNFLIQIRGQVLLLSLFMIFCVLLNNFQNTWLSKSSQKKIIVRIEEIKYKNLLFIYLFVMGIIILLFNNKKFRPVFSSVIVCGLHFIFVMALIKINPYKQSLKVHTVTLFINNGIVMVSLIFINLLNYISNLDELFVVAFGYFLTGGTGLSLLLTFIRLYYELRYGRVLEEQIIEEKERKRKKEKEEKEMKLRDKQQRLINEVRMKKTEQQKMREKNIYLYENMVKEEEKMDYFQWLQKREWDQKTKDKQYFKSYDQKPLYYLKISDPKKYDEKIEEMQKKKSIQKMKRQQRNNDPQYHATVIRLRKQIDEIKKQYDQKKK